jgi:pimeloyl-ACP methyl ester carboxylesterase
MATYTLALPEVDLVYDVHGPLPPTDGRPPLLLVGQPMTAEGFHALAGHLDDRTVVTYDPRGLGRSSVRRDGRVDLTPQDQASDLHALIGALDAGPVDVFGSSGGAVTGLALVTAHPEDVVTLVAHEPPLLRTLPDAEAAGRATRGFQDAYTARGQGAGMAAFMTMASWPGEFTEEYFAAPPADPTAFGMPAEDDGVRDDPLLSDRAIEIIRYRVDVDALAAGPTRVVLAVGEESARQFPGRAAAATAGLLGHETTVFPGHHGGFAAEEGPWPGQATAFAARLREVLDSGAP